MNIESLPVAVARTAVIVPFRAASALSIADLVASLTGRLLPGRTAADTKLPLWDGLTARPAQIDELTTGLKAIFEIDASVTQDVRASEISRSKKARIAVTGRETGHVDGNASCRYLRLSQRLLAKLGQFAIVRRGTRLPLGLRDVHVAIYPSGNGHLALFLDWLGDVESLTLGELEQRLADVRQAGSDLSRYAWAFASTSSYAEILATANEKRLADLFRNEPLSPKTVINSLLNGPGQTKRFRLPSSRYVATHTFVYLDKTFDTDDEAQITALREHNFRLRRAYSSNYSVDGLDGTTDIVLQPRSNRIVGIAREGSAALVWRNADANEASRQFDAVQWPDIFVGTNKNSGVTPGIFYLLHSHARFERADLDLLSGRVSWWGGLKTGPALWDHRPSYRQLMAISDELGRLRDRIVAHTLTMTYPDSGGVSEYATFYRAQRKIFCTDEALEEIRAKLGDIDRTLNRASADMERKIGVGISIGLALLGSLGLPAAYLPMVKELSWVKTLTGGNDLVTLLLLITLVTISTLGIFVWSRRR